jgi:hypothetical protein
VRILPFLALLLPISCKKPPDPPIHPLPLVTDSWEVHAGRYAGRPVLLRINRGLDSIAAHTPLVWQAAASVPLKHPLTLTGLPDPDEVEKLKQIEQLLDYRLVFTELALFALKVETDSRCDFIYYTDNRHAVGKVFEHLSKLITDYPVEFSIKRDPKWITYRMFLNMEK